MAQSEMHLLFQQMGEVLNSVRGLHDTIGNRQGQAEQLHELVRTDLATLRRDQRELEEKFECIVLIVQHEVESLRSGTAEHGQSIGEMIEAIDALRRPIAEILGLKSRVAGLVFGAGIIGSAALWLVEPVYGWFVNTVFLKR